jgi:hypothetical protein
MSAIPSTTILPNTFDPISPQADSISPPAKSCTNKVWNVAKSIFAGILAAALLIVNPTLFIAGFFVGIVWSDQAKEAIRKIVTVWNKQPYVGSAMLIGAGVLTLPPTLAACSFLYALHVGNSM